MLDWNAWIWSCSSCSRSSKIIRLTNGCWCKFCRIQHHFPFQNRIYFATNFAFAYWKSELQIVVSLSSGEAKYVTIFICARDVTWLRKLIYEAISRCIWNKKFYIPLTTIDDGHSAPVSILNCKISTVYTKHISIRYRSVRTQIEKCVVERNQ